jgi:glycine cleavage system H protein
MKELGELQFSVDVRYAKDHEWVRREGDRLKVGISDYAQDQLGDITFVEMPGVGDLLERGALFGTLESTKAVGELFMPVNGEILSVNEALAESPELVNTDPYGEGWIVEVKPTRSEEFDALMTKDEYVEMLKGLQ